MSPLAERWWLSSATSLKGMPPQVSKSLNSRYISSEISQGVKWAKLVVGPGGGGAHFTCWGSDRGGRGWRWTNKVVASLASVVGA